MPFSRRPTTRLVIESQGRALLPRSFQQSFPASPSGGVPRPSFPGLSSSPSQLVLLGGAQALLPRSFLQSFPAGPSRGGGSQALLPKSFQQSFPAAPSRGSHVTYPIVHLMLPVCSPDTNWWLWLDAAAYILLSQCIMGKVTWDPPHRVGQTDWQTNTTENITFPQTTYAGGKHV